MTSVPPRPPTGGSRPGGTSAQTATPTPTGFIGRYQLLEKIAEGGMGSLFLARDPAIDRLVAIKLLRRGFDTESVRERFAREARAAGRLRHPNIVTIFDVGEHDGDPFIAMEFLAGETVGELIRQGAGLTLSRRLKLLEELCDGLAYAHRAGLVHRDIKPANLMVDADGILKILDFGIVRVSESGMTQAGVLVGTINYMSPEQVLGSGVDHRSDIFSVGLVAYELLSGRQAFPGTMKDGLLKRIPEAEIPALPGVNPGLDAEVVAVVEHALKKEPADRYQDLAKMRNDLLRVRQRIEVMEERAAEEAASSSAETAVISQEPTLPGVVLEAPRPSSTPELLAFAERALAEGNFRFALTIAGRAAALNPEDRYPSRIVARAEAGLLDRGRASESSPQPPPKSSVSTTASAPPSTGRSLSTPIPGASARGNYLAIAVALLALAVAGLAVWSKVTPTESGIRDSAGQPPPIVPDKRADSSPTTSPSSGLPGPAASAPSTAPSAAPVPPPPASSTTEPPAGRGRETGTAVQPPGGRTSTPRREPQRGSTRPPRVSEPTTPAPPPAPTGPVRLARAPAVVRRVPAEYPASARNAGIQGTVVVDATIDPNGAVTDARVIQGVHPSLDEAAVAAVRQWQFERSVVDGQPVSVQHAVDVPFKLEAARPPASLPGSERPAPTTPAPPPAVPPPAPRSADPPKEKPPARDLRAEALAAISATLKQYEAAHEARNVDALARVQVLSAAEKTRQANNMRALRDVSIDMDCSAPDLAADNQRATVVCSVAHSFVGPVGGRERRSVKQTFDLEKRGDNWMILALR